MSSETVMILRFLILCKNNEFNKVNETNDISKSMVASIF